MHFKTNDKVRVKIEADPRVIKAIVLEEKWNLVKIQIVESDPDLNGKVEWVYKKFLEKITE